MVLICVQNDTISLESKQSPGQNANAKSVTLSPDGNLTWRLGGGMIDLLLFGERSVDRVVKSVYEVLQKPILPPFWSLGYHLCRWGYRKASNFTFFALKTSET